MSALYAELQFLSETLILARKDLKDLLLCDHPPDNKECLVDHELGVIADLEWLICDVRNKILLREFSSLKI